MKYLTTVVSDSKYYNIDLDSEMEANAPGSSIRHARDNDLLGMAYKTARDADVALQQSSKPTVQPTPTAPLLTPEGHPLRTDIDPEAKSRMDKVISRAKAEGIDVRMVRGNRTADDQADLYAMGRTKPGDRVTNAKPGTSNHETGRAFDLAIHNDKGEIDWNDPRMQRVGAIGKEEGLKWGGDWKTIKDVPHFELDGRSATQPTTTPGASYTPPATGTVWDRVRSYDSITNAAALKYGISPDLIRSVMRHESGGDPKAVSHSNAKGLMQHLDGTFKDMGGGDVFDPATSIDHGAKYLAQLKREFGSDRAAVIAYHQGPGTTRSSLGVAVGPKTQAYVRDVMASVSEEGNPSAPRLTYTDAARQSFASGDPRMPVVLEGMRLMGYTPEQFGNRMHNAEFIESYYQSTMKHAETINPKLTVASGEGAYLDALKSVRGVNEPSQHPTPTVGRAPNPPSIQNPFSSQGQVEATPPPVSQGGASGTWSNGASGAWEESTTDAIARVEAKSVEQGQAAFDVAGRTVGKVAANLTRLAEDAIFAVVPRSADSTSRASEVIQGGVDAMFGKPRNQTDVVIGGLLEFYLPYAHIAKPLALAAGLTGKIASTVAGTAVTFAQNPDGPTNSEAIEGLIRGSEQPSEVRALINHYILGNVGQSDFEQRLYKRVVRGVEDAAFGVAIDSVIPLFKGIVKQLETFRNWHAKPTVPSVRLSDASQGTPQVKVESAPSNALDAPRIDSETTGTSSTPHTVESLPVDVEPTTRVGKDLQVLQTPSHFDADGIDSKRVTRTQSPVAGSTIDKIQFHNIRTPQDMAATVESVTKMIEIDPKYHTNKLPSVNEIVDHTGATKAEVQGYLDTVGGQPGPRTQAVMLMSEQAQSNLRTMIDEYLDPFTNPDGSSYTNIGRLGREISDLVTLIGDIGRQFRHDYHANNSLGMLSMTPDGMLKIHRAKNLQGDVLVDGARKLVLHLDDLFRNASTPDLDATTIRALGEGLDVHSGGMGAAKPGQTIGSNTATPSPTGPKPVKGVAAYARGLTSPTFGGALSELWFNSVLAAFKTVSKTAWSAGEQLLLKPAIRFFGALEQADVGSYKPGESPEMMEALIMYKSMISGTPEMIRTMANKLFHNVDTYLEKGGSLGQKVAQQRQFSAGAFERIPLVGGVAKNPFVASFLNTTGAVLDFVGGRGLATVDEGLHFQVQRYEVRATAYRKAQGMTDLTPSQKVDWAENYVDQFETNGLIDDATRSEITRQKKMASFMQELGSEHGGFAGLGKFVAGVEKQIGHNPLARVMFPFARSAFNTLQLKAEMTPGLNMVSSQFRADMSSTDPWIRAEAQGRFFTGIALATAAAGMGAAGITRGIQTTNPDYKRELERAGTPNNSMTVLGQTMRLDPNEPLGWFFSTFGAIGAMGYGNAVTEEELSASELALHSLAELLKSAPYMSAISDLMTTSDPRRLAAKIEEHGLLGVGVATVDDIFLKPLWLPGQVGRGGQELLAIFQPHKRVVDGAMDVLTARNGFGLDDPKQTDILGRVRFKGNGLSEDSLNNSVVNIAALDVSNTKDPLSLKLTRHGVHIPDPSSTFSKFGASVKLTDTEQQRLRELIFKPTGAAATLRESLENLVARDDWDSMHSHTAQLMVDELVGVYVANGREQYYNQNAALQGKVKEKLRINGLIP